MTDEIFDVDGNAERRGEVISEAVSDGNDDLIFELDRRDVW